MVGNPIECSKVDTMIRCPNSFIARGIFLKNRNRGRQDRETVMIGVFDVLNLRSVQFVVCRPVEANKLSVNRSYLTPDILGLVCLIFFSVTFSQVALSTEQNTEQSTDEIAREIEKKLDYGRFNEAKRLIDLSLETKPGAPRVLYQKARYLMKTGVINDDSLIGFHYHDEKAQASIDALTSAIEIDPDYTKAYSLLGHVYAIQGDVDAAEAQFREAEKGEMRPIWLDYNMALAAIRKEAYLDAIKRLLKNTDIATYYRKAALYIASWNALRPLLIKHPELDPVNAVREGLAKRVIAENFPDYIKTTKNSEKLVFVHFSSSDERCLLCKQSLEKVDELAKKYADKYDFVYVSFEPWYRGSFYKEMIAPPILMKTVPAFVAFKQGWPLYYHKGRMTSYAFEQMLEGSFTAIKPGRYGRKPPARNNAKASISYQYNNYMAAEKDYKALAVAMNGNDWQTVIMTDQLSQEIANKSALYRCESARIKGNTIDTPCQLYAIGDKKVYGKPEQENNKFSKMMTKIKLGPLDKYLKRYQKVERHKALAFTKKPGLYNYRWAANFSDNNDTLEQAKTEALKQCDKNRKAQHIKNPCEIYFEESAQIKEFELN